MRKRNYIKVVFDPIPCKRCGDVFIPKNKRNKYCSYECAAQARADYARRKSAEKQGKPVLICAYCGKEFIPKAGKQIYCSKQCAKNFHNGKVHSKICVVCGKKFAPTANAQTICSDECRRKRANMLHQEERRKYTGDTPVIHHKKRYSMQEWNALTPEERWELMPLGEISAESARLRKSYGKIQTMYYSGSLPKDFGIRKRKTRKAVKK